MDTLVTSEWLKEKGVKLSADKLAELTKAAQDELEMRTDEILFDMLTPEQVDAFEKISAEGNYSKASSWLDEAIPDYKKALDNESAKMHEELEAASDKPAVIRGWAKRRQKV